MAKKRTSHKANGNHQSKTKQKLKSQRAEAYPNKQDGTPESRRGIGYGDKDDLPLRNARQNGKKGLLANLNNAKETKKDLRMLDTALRKKWNIRNKIKIQKRLVDVISKQSVPVLTKDGIFESEQAADANAIMAARCLVQMNGQDQADDHLEIKCKLEQQPGTVVNVLNSNNTEPGQSRFIQLAQSLGASILVVDGKEIPTTDSTRKSLQAGTVQ